VGAERAVKSIAQRSGTPVNHKPQVNPTAMSAALTMSRNIEPPFCCQVCLFLTKPVQGNISRSRSFAPSLAELLARLLQFLRCQDERGMEDVLFTIAMPIFRVPSLFVETAELNSLSIMSVTSMSLRTAATACFEVPMKPDANTQIYRKRFQKGWRCLSSIRNHRRPPSRV
jgi:hypothetical protein